MLKTTIGLLTFFLALFIGLFAAIVWIRSSQESCGFATPKVEHVDVFHNSTLAVKSEPADSFKLAACENPNPAKAWIPAGKYRTISGGVLNNQITCGVLPEYPVSALERGISGDVILDVLVDEWGAISKASVKSGHPALRQASLKAALQSGTTPRLLGGESVRMRGVLLYRFDDKEGALRPEKFPVKKSAPLNF